MISIELKWYILVQVVHPEGLGPVHRMCLYGKTKIG